MTTHSHHHLGDRLIDWGLGLVIILAALVGIGILVLFFGAIYIAIHPTYPGSRHDAIITLVVIAIGVVIGCLTIVRSALKAPEL